MKRILLFILMLIPSIVFASENIKVESIELVNKDETVTVLEEPTIEDLNIILNLQYEELDTKLEYKIKLSNNSDKEYEVELQNKDLEYITITGQTLVIKPQEDGELSFIIEYKTEPESKIELKEKLEITLKAEQTNPKTSTGYIIFITLLISLIVIAVLLIIKDKININRYAILIIMLGMAPLTIAIANEIIKETITIDLNVTVGKNPIYKASIETWDGKVEFEYENGMTWREWLESDYNSFQTNSSWEIYNIDYDEETETGTYKFIYEKRAITDNDSSVYYFESRHIPRSEPDDIYFIHSRGININCGDVNSSFLISYDALMDEDFKIIDIDEKIIENYEYQTAGQIWC